MGLCDWTHRSSDQMVSYSRMITNIVRYSDIPGAIIVVYIIIVIIPFIVVIITIKEFMYQFISD
jgi:hypothetical protein